MWTPYAELPYYEIPSTAVVDAVGRHFSSNPTPETRLHIGLFQATYRDVATDTLLVRARLQNYAIHPAQYRSTVNEPASAKKKK